MEQKKKWDQRVHWKSQQIPPYYQNYVWDFWDFWTLAPSRVVDWNRNRFSTYAPILSQMKLFSIRTLNPATQQGSIKALSRETPCDFSEQTPPEQHSKRVSFRNGFCLGLPERFIQKICYKDLKKVKFCDKNLALQQRVKADRVTLHFVMQYSPLVLSLKQILMDKWHLIKTQPLLKTIFSSPLYPVKETSLILAS